MPEQESKTNERHAGFSTTDFTDYDGFLRSNKWFAEGPEPGRGEDYNYRLIGQPSESFGLLLSEKTMERKFINELTGGERIESAFLLRRCDLRQTRGGKFYLDMQVGDRTGILPAKRWDANEHLFEALRDADTVLVKGTVETYRDTLQLAVDQIRCVKPEDVDLSELLPHTERDIDAMWQSLLDTAASIKDPYLMELLEKITGDEEIAEGFKSSPAAVNYHHPFIGGLLEHTVSVLDLAEKVLPNYHHLDRDLLLTGVILHDIGKMRELSRETNFKYTDSGELLGHIVLGVLMLEDKVREIAEFPEDLLMKLQHLILSHHGQYEFGSPKLPMTIESIALHHLDNLDAKLNAFTSAIESEGEAEGNWTQWNRMFQRRLYRK